MLSIPSTALGNGIGQLGDPSVVDAVETDSRAVPLTKPGLEWLPSTTAGIQQQEYLVTWAEGSSTPGISSGYQAPNRAQDFRTHFSPQGIRMVPRTQPSNGWVLDLSLTGFGRSGMVLPIAEAVLIPDGSRMEYDRGDLMEWFENGPAGLKHGFTVAKPPSGIGNVVLEMVLSGDLIPRLDAGGDGVDLMADGGAIVLRYASLSVLDAVERELPSWLELDGDLLRIVFTDDGAEYPLTVDPLMMNPSWSAESDQDSAAFGFSVSTAGDVNGDGYDDVIVGAPHYDNGEDDEGRAFVYHGNATGLSTIANWTAEGNWTGAEFGYSVSTAGDVNGDGFDDVIVGSRFHENGTAYVFHGSLSGLSLVADWIAEPDQYARFGSSVSTAGDVNNDSYDDVIIGAPRYDNGENEEGRAFVYYGSATGLSVDANWTAESDQVQGHFGSSVAAAGDVNGDGYDDVIVGAVGYDNGKGGAFVYNGSVTGLSTIANWTAKGTQTNAWLGNSVSTAGDVNGDGYDDVIVGARYYDNGQKDEGGAFLYHGAATGLSTIANWTAEGDQKDAHFGMSVCTAGDVNKDGFNDVIVGAHFYDNNETNEGMAFVYHGSSMGLSLVPHWTAESNQDFAWLGRSVCTAGDVNGDGYDDVIVGAHWYDSGQEKEGMAFVFRGGEDYPEVIVFESGGSTNVVEGNATDNYTVVLATQPSENVTIIPSADEEVNVFPLNLTFTPIDWNTPQIVMVSAVDDDIAEGTHIGTITHNASSADPNYNWITIASAIVNITDNDLAGVRITPTALNVTEGGDTDSYTVVLSSQPTANVTVNLTTDGQLMASPRNLTFTTADWNVSWTVNVTAVDDAVVEGAHKGTITHNASSTDPFYNNTSIADVIANITDNDFTVPSEPLDLQAIEGNQNVTLTWSAPSFDGNSPITNYRVYRGTTSGGEMFLTEIGNVLVHTDMGLIEGQTYYYQVSAVNAVGEGPRSNETNATVPTVPSAPQNLKVTAGDANVNLTWAAPDFDGGSSITNYSIYRGTTSGGETFLVQLGNVLNHTDVDVVNGETYYYRVGAVNPVGEGPRSNEASATPTGPVNSPPTAAFEISPPTVTVGENVTFNASSSSDPDGIIVSFAWDFGDGETGTGEVVNHEYGAPGTYNVTLAVTDDGGLTANATQSLVVTAISDTTKPTVVITEPPDSSILTTLNVTVIGTARDDVAIEKVEVSIDGANWTLATGTANWSALLALSEGLNTIYARATDTSGNKAFTTVTVTVEIPPPDEEDIVVLPLDLILLTALGVSTTLIFFRIESIRLLLLKFLFLPLYVRIKKDKVLDNFLRGRIYEYIRIHPGDRYTDIKKYMGLKNGPLLYHLDVLEREGFIKSRKSGTNRLFYPMDSEMVDDGLHRVQRLIVEGVEDSPGISAADLAGLVGVSQQLVNYHVKQLAGKGLVRVERRGVRNRFYLSL